MTESDGNNVSIHCVQKLYGHSSDVSCCDFCGNKLVTCSTDKTVRIWDIQDELQYVESLHSPLIGHKYGILSCCFSPFGSMLATSSIDGNIILWNMQTGTQLASLRHPSGQSVRACRFSPNSKYLATGSEDYLIALWNVESKALIRTFAAHEDIVTCVAFTPDSHYLVSGSSDCTLELWSVDNGASNNLFCLKDVHDLGVVNCDFSTKITSSEDGFLTEYVLATCGNDDFVKIWKVCSGIRYEISLIHQLEGHSANVMCCRFSSDGFLLASVSGDKSVIIWDPKCGQMIVRKEEHSRYVTSCAFSANSQLLVTGSNDRTIIVWKVYNQVADDNIALDHNTVVCDIVNSDAPCSSTNDQPAPDNSSKKQLSKWSCNDVCDWLESINLEQYSELFKENAIDGQELLYLTQHTLESKLKIGPYGHRNRILRGITLLKNPSSSTYMDVETDDSSIPEEYFCPITQQLMNDPVIAADGHSYERSAISSWLMKGNKTSPMTNDKLPHEILTPNHLLKSLIKRLQ